MYIRNSISTFAVVVLLYGMILADEPASQYPAEIDLRDLDRIAQPVGRVNTTELATHLGITDSLVIWFKFKLNGEGHPSKIEVLRNPGDDSAVAMAQAYVEKLRFETPSGRNKRKTHYYGLIICPDAGGNSTDTYRMRDFNQTKEDLDRAWQEALRSNGLTADGRYEGCLDSTAVIFPEMSQEEVPRYPREALSSGESGTVTVQCIVATDGRVPAARVLKSAGDRQLDDSAVRAATRCRFKPAICGDKEIPCVVSFTYTFETHK